MVTLMVLGEDKCVATSECTRRLTRRVHTFGVISAYAHETLPQSRLVKDLVIGKSGEVCSKSSYCQICRSQCNDCVLAQVVEEWIGDLCPGGDDRGGERGRDWTGRSGSVSLLRALVDLPAGEAKRESV